MLQDLFDTYAYPKGTLHCSYVMLTTIQNSILNYRELPISSKELENLIVNVDNHLLNLEYSFISQVGLMPDMITYLNHSVDLTMLAYLKDMLSVNPYYNLCSVYSPQLYGIAEYKHVTKLSREAELMYYYDSQIADYLRYLVEFMQTQDYINSCNCNNLGGFEYYMKKWYNKALPITSLDKAVFITQFINADSSTKYDFYTTLSDMYNLAYRLVSNAGDLNSLGEYKDEVYVAMYKFIGEYEMLMDGRLETKGYKLSQGVFQALALLAMPFSDAILESLRRNLYYKHQLANQISNDILANNGSYTDWQRRTIQFY